MARADQFNSFVKNISELSVNASFYLFNDHLQEGSTTKKKTKDEDSIASVLHSTQKSTNYALPEGTLEVYNDGHKKELTVVWDATASVYRLATDHRFVV